MGEIISSTNRKKGKITVDNAVRTGPKGGSCAFKAAARSEVRGTGSRRDRQLRRRLAGRISWLLTSWGSAACGLLQLGKLPARHAASLQENDAA